MASSWEGQYCICLSLLVEISKDRSKILKGYLEKRDGHGSFEKIQHIPGDLEDYVHVEGCMHIQERPKWVPGLLNKHEDLCKQKVKAQREL